MTGARLLVIAALLALTVTGCGRRGAPEPPASASAKPLTPVDAARPDGAQAPDRAFALDKLLQ